MKFRIFNSYNRKLFLYFFIVFSVFSVAVGVFQYEREKSFKIKQLETTLFTYNQMVHSYLIDNADSMSTSRSLLT